MSTQLPAALATAALVLVAPFVSTAFAQTAPGAGTATNAARDTVPAGHPPVPPAPAASKQIPATKPAGDAAKKAPPKPAKKVDINNASLSELKTLPTVGDEEAKKIVEHRPYKSKGELFTKAGLPEGVYHAIKRKVEMQTPRKPAK